MPKSPLDHSSIETTEDAMHCPSNMTPEECFRLHGTLTPQLIEELLDATADVPDVDSASVHIQEARGCFPKEDFLAPILDKLHDLAKHLRGKNREDLQAIIESLDDLAQLTFNECDYGRSELSIALHDLSA